MDRERNRGRGRDEESRSRGREDDRNERGSGRDDDRGNRDRDDSGARGRGADRDSDSGSRSSRDRDDDRGGRARSSFAYEGRSREQIDKRAKMRGKEFDRFISDGVKVWTPGDGINSIRILPPTWKGAEHYGLDLYVHYGVGPDRQSYLCLTKMLDKPDPIAEEHATALRDGEDKDYVKSLEAKRRCGVYLIDRDAEKEGVQFWAMPWTIDADINKLSVDRKTGETLNIDDPEDGYDIEFEKTGTGARTKYEAVAIARRSSPLGNRKWLDYAVENPIPDQLVYFEYDHIAKAFGGAGAHRGREEEREERGRDDSDREDRSRGRDRSDRDEDRERGRDRSAGSRDRDDDRGSSRGESDRGASRSRDDGNGRDRDREDDRGRRASRTRDEPAHSWESIHDMTMEELESFCESEEALQDVNPAKADGRADLADWICEELKIKKTEVSSRRRIEPDDKGKEESSDRLRKMREERGR